MRTKTSETQHEVDRTCEHASMCASERTGHALSLIQLRVASATPSKWLDATVSSVSADGGIVLAPVFGNEAITVWNHADLRGTLAIGDPVALHTLYDVLAVGDRRFNVIAD